VTAANGSTIKVLGHRTINFGIQGKPLQADLLVADDVDEFMLGFDWLTAQKARWHFNSKTLTLHGRTVPLCTRPSTVGIQHAAVRVVNLSENTINLPAETDLGTAEVAIILQDIADTVSTSLWSKATTGTTYEHIQSVVDFFQSELSVEECLEAVELLNQYQNVFSRHEYDFERTTLI